MVSVEDIKDEIEEREKMLGMRYKEFGLYCQVHNSGEFRVSSEKRSKIGNGT